MVGDYPQLTIIYACYASQSAPANGQMMGDGAVVAYRPFVFPLHFNFNPVQPAEIK